jgi:hypothetical protein
VESFTGTSRGIGGANHVITDHRHILTLPICLSPALVKVNVMALNGAGCGAGDACEFLGAVAFLPSIPAEKGKPRMEQRLLEGGVRCHEHWPLGRDDCRSSLASSSEKWKT